jgi:hypothetical protein
VTTKNAVFWDVTSCGSCKNLRFKGKYRIHHKGEKELSQQPAEENQRVVASSLSLSTLIIEAMRYSEASDLTRATWCSIPEDGIFQVNFALNFKVSPL